MKGIFVDCETGGFDPETCALLEVAAVAFETNRAGTGLIMVNDFLVTFRPEGRLTVCAEALEVSGRSWDSLKKGVSERGAFSGFEEFCKWFLGDSLHPSQFWAHNQSFDAGFLSAWERRLFFSAEANGMLTFPRRGGFGCTRSLCDLLKSTGRIDYAQSSSLHSLAQHFGIPAALKGEHGALEDARTGVAVLERLLKIAGWMPYAEDEEGTPE